MTMSDLLFNLVQLNCFILFFINLKLELLALNEENIFMSMQNRLVEIILISTISVDFYLIWECAYIRMYSAKTQGLGLFDS